MSRGSRPSVSTGIDTSCAVGSQKRVAKASNNIDQETEHGHTERYDEDAMISRITRWLPRLPSSYSDVHAFRVREASEGMKLCFQGVRDAIRLVPSTRWVIWGLHGFDSGVHFILAALRVGTTTRDFLLVHYLSISSARRLSSR